MNCILCKSNLIKWKVNYILGLDSNIIIIKDVPANVCKKCGEYFIENHIGLQLEKIAEEAIISRVEIFIINYDEVLK